MENGMKGIILCRTTAKEMQSLYFKADGKEYYLFSQDFRRSVKAYYQAGVTVDRALDYSASESRAVRRTMKKLRAYIPYVEKEHGICILTKTKKARMQKQRNHNHTVFDEYDAA